MQRTHVCDPLVYCNSAFVVKGLKPGRTIFSFPCVELLVHIRNACAYGVAGSQDELTFRRRAVWGMWCKAQEPRRLFCCYYDDDDDDYQGALAFTEKARL